MAIYTIYPPPDSACPVDFIAGDFWDAASGKFTLAVRNNTSRPITHLSLTAEYFLAPQDLRRPFDSVWSSNDTIAAHAEQTLQKPAYAATTAHAVLGWVFFPSSITYADGTKWSPKQEGECFRTFWSDKDHPAEPALPPRQFELNPD